MSETRVKASIGVTYNIGNFQNIRIDLGIEDDRREGESAKQAMDRVYAFVERELEERIEKTVQEMKKDVNG